MQPPIALVLAERGSNECGKGGGGGAERVPRGKKLASLASFEFRIHPGIQIVTSRGSVHSSLRQCAGEYACIPCLFSNLESTMPIKLSRVVVPSIRAFAHSRPN